MRTKAPTYLTTPRARNLFPPIAMQSSSYTVHECSVRTRELGSERNSRDGKQLSRQAELSRRALAACALPSRGHSALRLTIGLTPPQRFALVPLLLALSQPDQNLGSPA